MSLIASCFCNQIEMVSIPTMGLMMFSTVSVGFYNLVGDATSNILILLTYLGWIGYTICVISGIDDMLLTFRNLPHHSRNPDRPNVKMKSKHKRRKRVKRITRHNGRRANHFCFNMNPKRLKQLYIMRHDMRVKPDLDGWGSISTEIPWWYKYRSFANEWENLSRTNSLLIDMTLNPTIFSIGSDFLTKRITELTFTVDDKLHDITKLVDCDFTFRSQSVYRASHDEIPIIFDSGASIGVSPKKSDFISLDESEETVRHHKLSDLTSVNAVKGVGTVRWLVYTENGFARHIEQRAYYVPSASVRLFSVHNYCRIPENKGSRFCCDENGVTFQFSTSSGGGKMKFNLEQRGGLPIAEHCHHTSREKSFHATRLYGLVHDDNINLTRGQKELLKLHFRYGHWNLQWIQSLINKGILHTHEKSAGKVESLCQCAACNLAKQTRRSEGTVHQKIRAEKDGSLKAGNLRPGSCVSTDQYVSSVPGRLPNTYGKERTSDKLDGGTIFVDDSSGFMFNKNQVSLGAAETIRAKHEFEREARRNGISILSYRGDNGVYKSKAFMDDLNRFGQTIDFAAVGGHHQNGVAERAIRTISTTARAMMIHALIHNPTEVSMDLWPFAIDYAIHLWNKMPKQDTGISPEEIFYGVKSDHSQLREARTWGCPAYVLDPKLQDGKKIPKWKPRSRLGQFLGRSRAHAGNVGLIRNLKTGAISPQFHVVYDDQFTTVGADITQDNIPVPDGFDELMRFSRESTFDPTDLERPTTSERHISITAPTTVTESEEASARTGGNQSSETSIAATQVEDDEPMPALDDNDGPSYDEDATNSEEVDTTPIESTSNSSRYPTRSRNTPNRFGFDEYANNVMKDTIGFHDRFLFENTLDHCHSAMTVQFDTFDIIKQDDDDEEVLEAIHPLAFAARANASDTPNWHGAMNGPDAIGFKQAMEDEIDLLVDMDSWDVVPRAKAISEGKKVVDSVWSFKRKRYPDGVVKKLKARFCIHGGQQEEGIDYTETFSPVVGWSTVRILLILSIMLELETKQVDFTLAFCQAKLGPGNYIEMPRGFEHEGHVLELKRNLYGGRASGANFFNLLKEQLERRGFVASKTDPCLFINHETGCMILTYVDDCCIFHKKESVIDAFLKDLESPEDKSLHSFQIRVESDYAGFLGIDIHRNEDGTIELLQIGLIDRILAALNLEDDDVAIKLEPASKEPLGKDEHGPPRKETWSYPSVIGMLLYLSGNSRPDIAYAVHQCCRFNHCARECHEKAIKKIARYLKGTKDRGFIFDPKKDLQLEMFCDADFAGLWNVEGKDDPICVRSRSGMVITFGEVPVIWKSKLQTEIAVSTMQAEYISLSEGMRELIPLKRQIEEICDVLNIVRDPTIQICKVHEDNEGALKLATAPLEKVTPQSKFFAIKYHWFRSKLDELGVQILGIRSNDQKADIFTKGLQKSSYQNIRKLLMGW